MPDMTSPTHPDDHAAETVDFAPNEGESGDDAALTVITKTLEYLMEPANDESCFSGADILWRKLTKAGFTIKPTATPCGAIDTSPEDAAVDLLATYLDKHYEYAWWNDAGHEAKRLVALLTTQLTISYKGEK